MSNSGTGQGVYSPLPQNITDSDSEEELHNSITTKMHQPYVDNTQERIMKNGGSAMHRFSTEDLDDTNGFVLGFQGHSDSINMLYINKSAERMSHLRKFFFVLSILFCFLTIIMFLWILPCSEACLSTLVVAKKSSWENPYHDIELKGAISVVDGVVGQDKNLILLFRGDVINPEHMEGVRTSNDNGIILIVGNSGKVGWFIRQPRLPTDIDCSLIDVDRDGKKDCIVIGKEGLFAAINPIVGTVHWYLHNHDDGNSLFVSVDFPIVLMDIDNDDVNDMLTTCTPQGSKSNNALILISGFRGSVIGKPLVISECMSINKLQIDKRRMLSFTCKNSTSLSESLRVMTLEELFKSITNNYPNNWKNWVVAKQHQLYDQSKETESQRNVYLVDGRKLIVENQGTCPKNCKVTVQLIDERSSKDNISWEYNASRVYGMVPATLVFNNSALKNRISGFVLKFWQWNVGVKNSNRYDRNVESYNIFDNSSSQVKSETENKTFLFKRNSNKNKSKKNENVTINHLTERVVLVTFNATNIHIVNASQSDIVQMCINDNCQPDMSFQENSLLITDLDGDGSQELITYLTTFVCTENASLEEYYSDVVKCDSEWKLKSTIRIVRLEAELPKLYEAVSHH